MNSREGTFRAFAPSSVAGHQGAARFRRRVDTEGVEWLTQTHLEATQREIQLGDHPKHRLHELVDDLPESEIATAERILAALGDAAAERFLHVVDSAPFDDEPDDDDFDGGLTEARSEESIPHEEARRQVLGE